MNNTKTQDLITLEIEKASDLLQQFRSTQQELRKYSVFYDYRDIEKQTLELIQVVLANRN